MPVCASVHASVQSTFLNMYISEMSSPIAIKLKKLQHNYSLAFVAGLKRATDEGSLPEIAQYSPYYLPLNVFTASKGSTLYILLIKSIIVVGDCLY